MVLYFATQKIRVWCFFSLHAPFHGAHLSSTNVVPLERGDSVEIPSAQ